MTTMVVPPGYRTVRLLKDTEYARERLERGALAVLDEHAATKLVKAKAAEFVAPEPERAMLRSTCVKCGAALEIVAEPAQHERWTSCLGCGFGWLR